MKEKGSSIILPEFTRSPDAVAIDLDGTPFDSNTFLSTRNREALEKCIKQGIPANRKRQSQLT